eukprot:3179322-Pyramimonas_sp.AAC.1
MVQISDIMAGRFLKELKITWGDDYENLNEEASARFLRMVWQTGRAQGVHEKSEWERIRDNLAKWIKGMQG